MFSKFDDFAFQNSISTSGPGLRPSSRGCDESFFRTSWI